MASRLTSAILASKNTARTENGALTNKSTLSPLVDLFFIAGASRGKDISSQYALAYAADADLSLRLALWLRDAREGAGERQQARNIFNWLIRNDSSAALAMLRKMPSLGRWDDVLEAIGTPLEADAISLIKAALNAKDGLCAKWMPRKGAVAAHLRGSLGMSPKQYRKTLVTLSQTVEQAMCAQNWDGINYSHVPSVAFSRYKKAFNKHSPEKFAGFVTKVAKGEAKINAKAIFPHELVMSSRNNSGATATANDLQWKALPNWLEGNNENLLVMCDTSSSMYSGLPGSGAQPIHVAISTALYISERQGGLFKDTIMTFDQSPKLYKVSGSLRDRVQQAWASPWGGNTNFQAGFELILATAIKHKLTEAEMPTKLIVVSDMEFDQAGGYGYRSESTNFAAIQKKYASAGYTMPQIVFWNVRGRVGNAPVTQHQSGAALVSGFSPSIVQSVLGQKQITPEQVMLKTLLSERYDY